MGGNAYMAQSEINKTNCSLDILLLKMYSCTLKIFSTDQIRSFWHPRPRSVITAIKRRMLNFISQLMQRYVISFPKVYHLFDLSKETRKRKHMKMKSRSFNWLQRRPKPLLNFTTTKKVVYAR